MAKRTVTLEVSEQGDKGRLTRLLKEYEAAALLPHLLQRAKECDQAEKSLSSLQIKYDELVEKMEKKGPESEREDLDVGVIDVLSKAITSLTGVNDSYSRENDRLLKIANISEYDTKINALRKEIKDYESDKKQSDHTISEKAASIRELNALMKEQKDEMATLSTELEVARELGSNGAESLSKSETKLAEKDSMIASLVGTNENYKAQIQALNDELEMKRVEVASFQTHFSQNNDENRTDDRSL